MLRESREAGVEQTGENQVRKSEHRQIVRNPQAQTLRGGIERRRSPIGDGEHGGRSRCAVQQGERVGLARVETRGDDLARGPVVEARHGLLKGLPPKAGRTHGGWTGEVAEVSMTQGVQIFRGEAPAQQIVGADEIAKGAREAAIHGDEGDASLVNLAVIHARGVVVYRAEHEGVDASVEEGVHEPEFCGVGFGAVVVGIRAQQHAVAGGGQLVMRALRHPGVVGAVHGQEQPDGHGAAGVHRARHAIRPVALGFRDGDHALAGFLRKTAAIAQHARHRHARHARFARNIVEAHLEAVGAGLSRSVFLFSRLSSVWHRRQN